MIVDNVTTNLDKKVVQLGPTKHDSEKTLVTSLKKGYV